MSKCNICRENESSWAWQPFGPNDTPDCFALLGNHYRGFAVVKVCDDCKDKVQAGKGIQFSYKRRHYSFWRGEIRERLSGGHTVKVAG